MNASTHDSKPLKRKRYPGGRPFSDSPEDRQIFFGRDADIDRLFGRVLGARLLVLFGKSGLGKTSLLKAGVFPRLRNKPFLPVPILLNGPGSPAEIVVAAMTEASRRAGAEITAGDGSGIWEFLRTSLIWQDGLLLTPVLVFDQFEEVFTLRDADFRSTLAGELGALATGTPPERLRTSERGAERGARLGEQPPEVKIVLSLREEYLGTLQELSGAIPGLFQERVRLAPLGEEDARLAICRPAARREEPGDAPFETPPFEYDTDTLDAMLAFLQGESKIIEPFQLQLLCCRAEEIVTARATAPSAARRADRLAASASTESGQGPPTIRMTSADLGGPAGMEAVLSQFYRHVIDMLSRRDRPRARRLCEEGLLSATGRRLPLEQTQIESDYGLGAAALATLVDERLLRREESLESLFYEISHDRLAESIEKNRPFRIPKKLRQTLKGAALVAVVTIGMLIWWNRKIEQARNSADRARSDAENLVAFLIGESFLEKLRPVGRARILDDVQKSVNDYLAKVPDASEPGPQRTRGLALRNAGDILLARGNLEAAILRFRDSAAVFERLSLKAERARSLVRLGNALLDQGKITESLRTHREALALRQAVFDGENRGTESALDLANSHSEVARILNQMGQPRQALAHLDRARDLLRPMEASAPRSPRLFEVMHDVIDNQAESLGLIGDAEGARDAKEQSCKVTQEWVQAHPLSADARFRQVIAVTRLANEESSRGSATKALEQYGQSNRTVEELTRWDDSNANWRRDFAATLILIAEEHTAAKQYQEALNGYNKALKLLEDLAETDRSNISRTYDLFWFYQSRGRLAVAREEWKEAIKDFTVAERYITDAAGIDQAFGSWQRDRYWLQYDLATARAGTGDHSDAADLLRRSREMVSELIEAAPEATVLHQDLVTFFEEEVRVLEDSGKKEEAAALEREKERAVTSALEAHPKDTVLLRLAHLDLVRVGDAAKAGEHLDDALTAYREGLKKITLAAELEPNNVTILDSLRDAHERIGDAVRKRDKEHLVEAEEAYRNGLDAGKKAFQIAPHVAELANALRMLQLTIGEMFEAAGKQESALTEFHRAHEWIDKEIEIDGNDPVLFDDRSALHDRVWDIKAELKDVDGVQKAYTARIEAMEQSARIASATEKAPEQAARANDLHVAHEKFGGFLEEQGDIPGALAAHGRALDALERAEELDANEPKHPDAMRLVYKQTARLKEDSGDAAGAEQDLLEGAKAGKRAADLENSAHYVINAGEGLFDLGNFYDRANSPDPALGAYREAADQAKSAITRLEGDSALYHLNFSTVRRMIGDLRERSKDAPGARDDFDAAVHAGRRATELAADNGENWKALYLAQWFLAENIEQRGDKSKALTALRDALTSAERAARLLPEDPAIREDVAKLKESVATRSRNKR